MSDENYFPNKRMTDKFNRINPAAQNLLSTIKGGDMLEIMIFYSMSMLGTPYIWGGNNQLQGFDCSGFVQEALASVGMDPPGDQTAQSLHDFLTQKGWPTKLERGSILFFGENLDNITHTSIALNERIMIEAGGGSKLTRSYVMAKEKGAYVRIRPIRKDLVNFYLPYFPF